jgi:hypothetical protein
MLMLKINFFFLKKYYSNIFSSKKYFEKQSLLYSQTENSKTSIYYVIIIIIKNKTRVSCTKSLLPFHFLLLAIYEYKKIYSACLIL